MSRKLRRKRKVVDIDENKKPKRKIKRYKAQRCAYVYSSTKNRCKNRAVGKSTLCKKHGGDPVIKENLVPATLEKKDVIGIVTKYDPTIHPVQYIDYSRMGLSEVEIAAEFGVSVDKLLDANPRLSQSGTIASGTLIRVPDGAS